MKRSQTPAFTVPKVVPGLCAKPSKYARREDSVKFLRGYWPRFHCATPKAGSYAAPGGAADRLVLKRTTLIYKVKKLGIARRVPEPPARPKKPFSTANLKRHSFTCSDRWLSPFALVIRRNRSDSVKHVLFVIYGKAPVPVQLQLYRRFIPSRYPKAIYPLILSDKVSAVDPEGKFLGRMTGDFHYRKVRHIDPNSSLEQIFVVALRNCL